VPVHHSVPKIASRAPQDDRDQTQTVVKFGFAALACAGGIGWIIFGYDRRDTSMVLIAIALAVTCAVCVVIAAKGYPDAYPKGDVISLPPASSLPPSTFIYHAGTAKNSAGQVVTSGGRVLGVTATAPTLRAAADAAYAACEQIQCASKYFRRDIGARQLNRR